MAKSIGKNILFKFILNLFNIIVPILVAPYVLRTLGDDVNGVINFSQSIAVYFFMFGSFGAYQYGLREISKVKGDKEKLSKVFTSIFTVTIITNLIMTVVYVLLIQFRYAGTNSYMASMILGFNLIANIFYIEWANEALENYDFITIKSIIIRIIYIILLFIFVKTSSNLKEYLILLGAAAFLNNIVSYIYVKRSIKFDFAKLELLKHVKPMFLVVVLSNANILYTQLDKFMLGEFVNTLYSGYYGIAQNIATIISGLMLTLVHVTIPRLSNYSANDNEKEYISLLDRISKLYFLMLFPGAIGMLALSKEIIMLYGGSEYIAAIPVLAIFAIYTITTGYESILTNQIIYIKKKEKVLIKILFIGGVINLIFNIVLLKIGIFTPSTAVFTTMIANIFVLIVESIYIKKKLKVNFNIYSMDKFKYMVISLLFIPITWVISIFIKGTILFSLVSVLVCGLVYFSILIIIKDEVFMEVLKNIIYKLTKKRIN